MTALLGVSRVIDSINSVIGRWVSWLILVAVIISTANAIIHTGAGRYLEGMIAGGWIELRGCPQRIHQFSRGGRLLGRDGGPEHGRQFKIGTVIE